MNFFEQMALNVVTSSRQPLPFNVQMKLQQIQSKYYGAGSTSFAQTLNMMGMGQFGQYGQNGISNGAMNPGMSPLPPVSSFPNMPIDDI